MAAASGRSTGSSHAIKEKSLDVICRSLKMMWCLDTSLSLLLIFMIVPMPAGLHGDGPEGCFVTLDLQLLIDIGQDFREGGKVLSVYGSADTATTTTKQADVLTSTTWDTEANMFICHFNYSYASNCTLSEDGKTIKLDLVHRFDKYHVQSRLPGKPENNKEFFCYDPHAYSIPSPESAVKPENNNDNFTQSQRYQTAAIVVNFVLIIAVIAWLLFKFEFLQWARQKWRTLQNRLKPGAPKQKSSTSSTSITVPEAAREQMESDVHSHITEDIRSQTHQKMEEMKSRMTAEWLRGKIRTEMEQMESDVHSHITEDIRSQTQKMEEMKKDVVSLKTQVEVMKSCMTEWRQIKTEMEEMKKDVVSLKTQAASDYEETGIVRLRKDVDPQVASENPRSCTVATIDPESAYFSLPVNSISGVQSSMQCPPNSSRPSRDPPPNREEMMMPSGSSQTQRQAAAAPASGGSNTQVSSTDDQAVTVSSSHAPSPEPAPSDSSTPIAFKPQSAVGKDAAHSSGAGSDKQCPAPPPTHKKEVMTQSGPPRTPTQVAAASVFDFNTRATEDQAVAMSSSLAPSRELAPSDSPPPIARKPKPAVLNDAATTSGAGSDKQCPAPPPAHKEEVMTQSGPLGTPTQVPSGVSEVQDAMNVQIGEFKENKGGQRGERRSQTPNITFQPALKR